MRMLKNHLLIYRKKDLVLWAGVFLLIFSITLTFLGVIQLEQTIKKQDHLLEVQRSLSELNDSIRDLSVAKQNFKSEKDLDDFLRLQKTARYIPEHFLHLQKLLQGDQRFNFLLNDLRNLYLEILSSNNVDEDYEQAENLTVLSKKIQFILNDDIYLARPSTLRVLDSVNIWLAIISSAALFFIVYASIIVKRSERAAQEASAMKSQFLAMVSHEIRTPLNGIISMSDFLRQKNLSNKEKTIIDILYTSSQSLRRLINDLLDFSKIESGKIELEKSDIHLKEFVELSLEVFKIKAANKDIKLILHFDDNLPTWVNGDSGRIAQILLNLVGNAIKFTTAGQVVVDVKLFDKKMDKLNIIQFSVQDTGCGIHADDFSKVFSPFTTLQRSGQNIEPGTGLGLSICKKIITNLSGSIHFNSTPGLGSKFFFQIPLTEVHAPLRVTATIKRKNFELPKKNILVVEDNSTNQLIAQTLLEKINQHVYLASNGIEAIKLMDNVSIDIILMDLHMPLLDGHETTKKFRSTEQWKDIPIIAMTANALKDEKIKCLKSGMNDYLTKPFVLQDLYNILAPFYSEEIIFSPKIQNLFDTLGKDSTYEILKSYYDGLLSVYKFYLDNEITSRKAKDFAHQFKSSSATLGFNRLTYFFEQIDEKPDTKISKTDVLNEIKSSLGFIKQVNEKLSI